MDIERMTGLPEDQVIDLAARVADTIGAGEIGRMVTPGFFDSLVAVLVYLRQDVTEDFTAAIFDVSQPTVSRRLGVLEEPISAALAGFVPDPVAATKGDVVLVDGTLVACSDWADQPDLFSGKHHRCGFNVQIAASLAGDLLAVGEAVHGARHDAHAWTASGMADQLAGCELIADLGYLGIEGIHTGTRKPPGGHLTDRQATANRSLSALRAPVERSIAHWKNWKILRLGYRRPLNRFPTVLKTVTALHHYEYAHTRHAGP